MSTTLDCPVTEIQPCPQTLSNDQIVQFKEQGYLAFSDVLTPEEVTSARESLKKLTIDLASSPFSRYTPPATGGNTSGASYQRPDAPCSMTLEKGFDPAGKTPEEIELKVRRYWGFAKEAEIFQRMVSPGSRLHGVVSGLLGPDSILFQEMALVKPPFIGSEKPWHQDNAYFSFTPLEAIMGVWLALDDATVSNGCMHTIPGGHKTGAVQHHHGSDCEIARTLLEVDRAIPVPVPAGGAMFFYGMLPHQTPPNSSPDRRRALQFHFRGAETRRQEDTDYDTVFVNRVGEAASCRSASARGF
jgi:phytanoyl-CoA hydroxylase